ncbi:MAG: hypothetical protein C0459_11445 [Chitinophaga sp.]|jgi:hypothetical protein|nr:hypothetical protein [Chitinophaga sp.]
MKKALTILLLLSGFYSFAQEKIILVQPKNDSLITDANKQLFVKRNFDNMPVIGNNLKQTFSYNNGKGFDVYKAEPDNMPVLKPDAGNEASLNIKNMISRQERLEIAKRLLDSLKTNKQNFYRFKMNPELEVPSDKNIPNR